MKVFISVGMHKRSGEAVRKDIEMATLAICERFGTDVEIIHNYDCPKPVVHSRLYYLGEAIKQLGKCDACYFVDGWQHHKGCVVEKTVCDIYGIQCIIESVDKLITKHI